MKFPTLHEYYFELPLYSKIKFEDNNGEHVMQLLNLIHGDKSINAYSPLLKENTTYKINYKGVKYSNLMQYNGLIQTELRCLRTSNIIYMISWLDLNNCFIQKIGQYPSFVEFHLAKIKDYQKVLGSEKLKEFKRAIGLAASGVGIGSFVYLRRVFEFLLEKSREKAKHKDDWNDELYSKRKIVDRIDMLKDYLPKFLLENKSLYSILSIGIHALDESDCLKYFETIRVGIELILDEEIEEIKKNQKIDNARKFINDINKRIS